ncbi:MAG: patatin-like phospholipase family protein [Pirellulales bacterium]|nr:patatin-like phospholipase family protein [Pirellulales bacterium]
MAGPSSAAVELLRRSALCQGLSPAELQYLAEIVRPIRLSRGETLYLQHARGDSMFFVARGRVRATIEGGGRASPMVEYFGKGEHFGDLDLLTGGSRTATIDAMLDAELLELEQGRFQKLMLTVPRFAVNLSHWLGHRLRWHTTGRIRRHRPAIIGLVNSTLRTQALIRPLCRELIAAGESVTVLTERAEKWPADGGYLIERIPQGRSAVDRAAAVHGRIGQMLEHHHRVLIDLTLRGLTDELPLLLRQCEAIWWLVDPQYVDSTRRTLTTLIEAQPELASRLHVVWILRSFQRMAPTGLQDLRLARPDFKVVLDDRAETNSRVQQRTLGRLVRQIRGPRLGLALGGGGARGLAHLGVLRAFEAAGLDFDLVSGTSIGALIGTAYAGGWEAQEALDYFCQELAPPWLVRQLPKGNSWYMWLMFQLQGWDRRLRRYLGQARIEQFQVPLFTVAVDLVTGNLVIRDSGDAANAILESINLPGVARPILRDGMVLVDGGILNNLPGDVLFPRGADFVVGVDVVSRLAPRYVGKAPGRNSVTMHRPGPIDTLLRVHEVQDHGLNAFRIDAVDFRIAPDTSRFEFADFARAHELAAVGERAASEALPQLKKLLAEFNRAEAEPWPARAEPARAEPARAEPARAEPTGAPLDLRLGDRGPVDQLPTQP